MRKPIRRIPAHAGLAAATLLLTAAPADAQVREVNLQEMVGSSGRIFVGSVTDVHGGLDDNSDVVTFTTFRVEQPVKGVMMGGTVSIKQFGGEANGISNHLAHMRYFSEGERILVMLYPESRLGFTSPIGMGQGVFGVTDDGFVTGITPTMLQGLPEGLLQRHGITSSTNRLSISTFVELVSELSRAEH